jgi:hypothetical protein
VVVTVFLPKGIVGFLSMNARSNNKPLPDLLETPK